MPVVLMGSCFTSSISDKMRSCLWDARNPFGTLYNPASISTLLKIILSEDLTRLRDSIFEAEGVYHSWLLDSSFSADSDEEVMSRYKVAAEGFLDALNKGKQLIVTFGTAWIYRLRQSEGLDIVANCHKQPQIIFSRERLEIDDIVKDWTNLISSLQRSFPGIKIIFTVSPVRHLKDGFPGNSRSKAILQLAVERLCGTSENVSYFPAYEIMMDDLRDYRFYSEDMVHPAPMAVDYIWDKFLTTYLTDKDKEILKEGDRLRRALSHRPLILSDRMREANDIRKQELKQMVSDFLDRFPGMLNPIYRLEDR